MSLRINLNTAALGAHRNLASTDNALGKSIERLSSGYKINNAGDDPAGLVISEKLRAQVSGLGQAIRNAGDAVNMVKTAEGALQEVNKLLRSMRDLAVHASNTGATDTASISADQAQVQSAIDSINKISSETQFGDKKLLDGSAGIVATPMVKVSYADLSKYTTFTEDTTLTIDVTTAGVKAQKVGVADLSGGMAADRTIVLNGVGIDLKNGDSIATVTSKINAKSDVTGVTAIDNGTVLTLKATEFGSAHQVDTTGTAAADLTAIMGVSANTAGTDAVVASIKDGDGNTITGFTADGNKLTDANGNTIAMSDTLANGDKAKLDVTVGTLTFQVGAYAGQTRSMNIGSVDTSKLGLGSTGTAVFTDVSKIDLRVDAQAAIKVLDKAISDISTQRANLGAIQKNTLESSINSLTIAKENIAASESTIRDTDMAEEMVTFTRNNILEQAGTAMLSQANQQAQVLLSLLR